MTLSKSFAFQQKETITGQTAVWTQQLLGTHFYPRDSNLIRSRGQIPTKRREAKVDSALAASEPGSSLNCDKQIFLPCCEVKPFKSHFTKKESFEKS